jgi:hypothetical protein
LAVDPQTIVGWLRRLVSLDTTVFDEIRGNPTATIPAVIIVAVSVLLSGFGGWFWWMARGYDGAGDVFVKSTLLGSILAVALWHIAWFGIVLFLLSMVFRERVFLEQLLRVMGVAMAPLGLGVASLVLAFGLAVIATQRVTTADPAKVLAANLAGFFVWASVLTLLVSANNQYAPGIFLYNAPADAASNLFDRIHQLKDITGP